MSLTKWLNYTFLIFLGIALPIIAYKANEAVLQQVYIQQHSPQKKMPIVDRVKGLGTVRSPSKIYVYYQDKKYIIECSNKYFNKTAQLDSLWVHFDPLKDRVVPADLKINPPYILLGLMVLFGFITLTSTIIDLRKQLARIDS